MATEFDSIPILDLHDIANRKHEIARELYTFAKDVGFFYIKNTGLDDVLPVAFEQAKKFFALPVEEKRSVDMSKSSEFRGYLGLKELNADPANRGDLHEGFNVGSDDDHSLGDADKDGKIAGNQWPQTLGKDFQDQTMAYFNAVEQLALKMYPLFALALGLPEDWFDDKVTTSGSRMRMLYYPPQFGVADDREMGIGAHTDFEIFTILAQQDGVKALQVKNKAGKWIDAPPIPGTFVVNLGDTLARWTNDLFVSTFHRAINRTGVERFSIPVFVGTSYDTIIETIPQCITADRPAHYPPIKAGDFVKQRVIEGFGY